MAVDVGRVEGVGGNVDKRCDEIPYRGGRQRFFGETVRIWACKAYSASEGIEFNFVSCSTSSILYSAI